MNEIYKGFNDELEMRGVFFDIFKAFDKVWHQGLIDKLQHNDISVSLLKLRESVLGNRK